MSSTWKSKLEYTQKILTSYLNAREGHNYSCHLFECELVSPVYSYHHFLVWSKNHENMRTHIRNAYFTLLHYDVMGAYHAIPYIFNYRELT